MTRSNLNLYWATLIIEELARNSCTYICVCPGSRSTPLTIAAARNPKIQTVICHDERGAAFLALGYARATQKPAVVITTSGTAVANLHPAIAEAAVGNIPLLILTADRPPELLDTGANQTMMQRDIFKHFSRWFFDIPCPTAEIPPEFILTTIDHAVARCGGDTAGPVHLNCMFREPFIDQSSTQPEQAYRKNIDKWENEPGPFSVYKHGRRAPDQALLHTILCIIQKSFRGLIIIGELTNDEQRRWVEALWGTIQWPVYADISSGMRLGTFGTHLLRYTDLEILSDKLQSCIAPDTVLHIGGRVVSKRVPEFFNSNRPKHYIIVKEDASRYDPVHSATMQLTCDIALFAQGLSQTIPPQSPTPYQQRCNTIADQIDATIASHIAAVPEITEPYLARRISEMIPTRSGFFISNSMPIRDVDIYACTTKKNIAVAVNRGISGIDGIIATACGFAQGQQSITTLLIGDLATIHDLNSLMIAAQCPIPLIVVIVNNHGGGLFHFLPIAEQTDVFNRYFITPHAVTFSGIAASFAIAYYAPSNKDEFENAYLHAIACGKTAIIEAVTDGKANFVFRRDLKKAINSILSTMEHQ